MPADLPCCGTGIAGRIFGESFLLENSGGGVSDGTEFGFAIFCWNAFMGTMGMNVVRESFLREVLGGFQGTVRTMGMLILGIDK